MNAKLKISLILFFLLFGLATLVSAAGTSSSSSSWGTRSSSTQENTSVAQGVSQSDIQQSPSVPQVTSQSDTQENPALPQVTSQGDTQKNPSVSLYDQGVEANKNGDYQGAKTLFEQALSTDSNNPDILNMLAHTQLKVGLIDESLENYKKSLQLRPKFPEAREYLGETYLQAALRELATLKSYGAEGTEQAEDLEKAIKEAVGAL